MITDCTDAFLIETRRLSSDLAKLSPHTEKYAVCEKLYQTLDKILEVVQAAYQTTCIIDKNSPDIDDGAKNWARLIDIIDAALNAMRDLSMDKPACCGQKSHFDFILDIRNAAQERLDYLI